MRPLILLLLAACASGSRGVASSTQAPRYAPAETVTVNASVGETARRLLSVYSSDGIAVASNTPGTITTAPVRSVALSAGSGAAGATGTFDYFYRATIAGDSVSLVTITLWSRLVTRAGGDLESPAREAPFSSQCLNDPECAALLERMREHARKLRESR